MAQKHDYHYKRGGGVSDKQQAIRLHQHLARTGHAPGYGEMSVAGPATPHKRGGSMKHCYAKGGHVSEYGGHSATTAPGHAHAMPGYKRGGSIKHHHGKLHDAIHSAHGGHAGKAHHHSADHGHVKHGKRRGTASTY